MEVMGQTVNGVGVLVLFWVTCLNILAIDRLVAASTAMFLHRFVSLTQICFYPFSSLRADKNEHRRLVATGAFVFCDFI